MSSFAETNIGKSLFSKVAKLSHRNTTLYFDYCISISITTKSLEISIVLVPSVADTCQVIADSVEMRIKIYN